MGENGMATEWYYANGNEQIGPVSESVLKSLARSGELTAKDLVWNEGMAAWKPAGGIEGLFAPAETAASESSKRPTIPPLPNSGATPESATESPLKTSFMATAKATAQFAANQAERVKLSTTTVPKLYSALGKYGLTVPKYRTEFPDSFKELDQVQNELDQTGGQTRATIKTISEKAKAAVGKAVQLAQSAKLSLRQRSLLAGLGKTIYERHQGNSGPENIVEPIQDALDRLETLNNQNAALTEAAKGSWITPKRLVVVGAIAASLFVMLGIRTIGNNMIASRKSLAPNSPSNSQQPDATSWKGLDIDASTLASLQEFAESDSESPAVEMKGKYEGLVKRVRGGMRREQVEAILGIADEEDEKDLGQFNPQKSGQILTLLTWRGDGGSKSSIVLSFVNDRLQDGGTPGYDINKGFHGELPSNLSGAEKAQLKGALQGVGFGVDE